MSNIENLIELSQTDQALSTTQRTLTEVEKQIKTARLPLDECERQFQEKKTLLEEVTLRHQVAQKQLGEADLFITKLESQVPLIRTQKEFNAGKKQLEDARKHRGNVENDFLESEIKQDEYQKELAQLQEDLEQKQQEFKTNIADLLKQQKTAAQQLETLKNRQETLILQLDTSLQTQYQNFSKRGLLPAICRVINKACSGCNSLLQPQLVNEMIAKPHQHRNCTFCYRIIYYLAESE